MYEMLDAGGHRPAAVRRMLRGMFADAIRRPGDRRVG